MRIRGAARMHEQVIDRRRVAREGRPEIVQDEHRLAIRDVPIEVVRHLPLGVDACGWSCAPRCSVAFTPN